MLLPALLLAEPTQRCAPASQQNANSSCNTTQNAEGSFVARNSNGQRDEEAIAEFLVNSRLEITDGTMLAAFTLKYGTGKQYRQLIQA